MTVASLIASGAKTLDAWVLVGPPAEEDGHEWSFRTLSARTVRDPSGDVEAVLDDNYVVHLVKKQKEGAFMTTILVGRSRTNDICIQHSSVSKLHARIRIGAAPPEPLALFLSDAGSSNGTTVNGEPVRGEAKLRHGDLIRFGVCTFQLFEPTRFVDILKRLG